MADSYSQFQTPVDDAGNPLTSEPSAGGQDTQETTQRPEWLPSKFNSPEELAKAYSELEKKLGQGNSSVTERQSEDTQEDEKTSENTQLGADFSKNEQAMRDQLQQAGLDFQKYQQKYLEKGQLDEEDYTELAQANLSREFVDSWIAGQEALVQQTRQDVLSAVGGEEGFNKVAQWANQNLSKAELDAMDQLLDNADPATAKMLLSGLNARYQSAVGREPNLLRGEPNTAPTGFKSEAEMVQAMRDPRYRSDPNYRREVERKVANAAF